MKEFQVPVDRSTSPLEDPESGRETLLSSKLDNTVDWKIGDGAVSRQGTLFVAAAPQATLCMQ